MPLSLQCTWDEVECNITAVQRPYILATGLHALLDIGSIYSHSYSASGSIDLALHIPSMPTILTLVARYSRYLLVLVFIANDSIKG